MQPPANREDAGPPRPDPSTPAPRAIAALCDWVEARAPGSKCGVCIANADSSVLLRAVFPNVPDSFQSMIKDIPMEPPFFGACNAVIHEAKVYTCHDMTKESRFNEQFVQLCVHHGIHSLQSWPVYGRGKRPIGTFVMAYTEFRPDPTFDAALMTGAARVAGEIIQRAQDRDATP